MTHERRICHVFTFAELENIIQNAIGDDSILILGGYSSLTMYGNDYSTVYEDEILDLLGTHFHRNFSRAFPIYDAQEVYIVESKPIASGLPRLVSWEWIDGDTFHASFGRRFDDDGDEYDLSGTYYADTGEWNFYKNYEDFRLYVYLEDHRNAMQKQMAAILKQEGISL